MPEEAPLRYFLDYNRAIWRPVAAAWWVQRGRILVVEIIVVLALAGLFALTEYEAIGWSIAISVLVLVGVAIVWLLCLGVSESARRDWTQLRALEEARGDLTDAEIRQAQRDRKILQRKAFRLLTMIHNAGPESIAELKRSIGQAIWDAVGEILDVAIQTDHIRGELYYDTTHELAEAMDRAQKGLFHGHEDFMKSVEALGKIESEDREWVMSRRRFTPPPEAPESPTASEQPPPSSPASS